MPNLRKIKDPVYGYVYYSELEEKIISHKLVLRLHYIRQNGAAYLTYPSMRVHRFEHSLGAMHVAGSLFKHAMEVSSVDVDKCIASTILAVTGRTADEIWKQIETAKPELKIFESDGFYAYNCLEDVGNSKTFGRLLVFQSVRIAALVHDIGHPPFSHTLETALKQNKKIKYPDHEIVGLELLRLIVEDMRAHATDGWYYFADNVLKLTDAIISKTNPDAWRVKGLSEIISSEIDADRLDYVRRDTLSAGSNTTAFDLGRLIDSVKLRCVRNYEKKGDFLQLIITADALSTIEAFFSVRFHLYRWMLWHHNVIRQNVALILSVKLIAKLQTSAIGEISEIASDFINLATDKSRRGEYWRFTDYYFLDRLVQMWGALEISQDSIPKNSKGEPYALLMRYLSTFLFREKLHLKPLWKRPDDYVRFARIVLGEGKGSQAEQVRALNRRVRDAYKRVVRREAAVDGQDVSTPPKLKKYERSRVDYLSGVFCAEMEKQLSADPDVMAKMVRVRAYYLAKFQAAPRGLKLFDRDDIADGGIDLDVLSPSVAALRQAWEALPQLWLLVENLPSVSLKASATDDRKRHIFYDAVGSALGRFLKAPAKATKI